MKGVEVTNDPVPTVAAAKNDSFNALEVEIE